MTDGDWSKMTRPTQEEYEVKYRERIALRQANCSHLKGKKTLYVNVATGERPNTSFDKDTDRPSYCHKVDYNVSHHIFIDGSERIQCLMCRKIWKREDENWNEAIKMTEQSTNTRTSSEIPIEILKNEIPIEILRNKRG